ncbi:MAG: hypothetical protein KBA40_02135 [Candidatus Peribacteraceae bacterium]|nr:hypothetical protein [Candidatus Peribacteraceae bacterium]MBP9850762.1 hypothetical protein [Candidatus Peribacteraceae bacterium]
MKKKKKASSELDLSNRELLEIMMQEISDVRGELKVDISELKHVLKADIADVGNKVVDLQINMRNARLEIGQNQAALVTNIETLNRRVTVLERR